MDKILTSQVFTPTIPARASFVEREKVNAMLVDALRTPGMQIVIYGHSGTGKTTLLVNKLHQLYDRHITTGCMKGMTFDQILRDAFDQLEPFFESGISQIDSSTAASQLSFEYLGIKSQISQSEKTETLIEKKRILPPELTPQRLGNFMGAAKCCWVLEDFHKIDEKHRTRLSQIMKVYMDLASNWSTLKIIAVGAVDSARQVCEYDKEMRNRVSEILVPLMEPGELREILNKGEELLNIKFMPGVIGQITKVSNGLAAVCHSLALKTCWAMEIEETAHSKKEITEKELESAITTYVKESQDTIKHIFDKAFRRKKKGKFDNFPIIIEAMAKLSQEGGNHSEILSIIRDTNPTYPASNLRFCLKELQTETRGELVRFDQNSGRYSFSSPFYRTFALIHFRETKKGPKGYLVKTMERTEVTKMIELLMQDFKIRKKTHEK